MACLPFVVLDKETALAPSLSTTVCPPGHGPRGHSMNGNMVSVPKQLVGSRQGGELGAGGRAPGHPWGFQFAHRQQGGGTAGAKAPELSCLRVGGRWCTSSSGGVPGAAWGPTHLTSGQRRGRCFIYTSGHNVQPRSHGWTPFPNPYPRAGLRNTAQADEPWTPAFRPSWH